MNRRFAELSLASGLALVVLFGLLVVAQSAVLVVGGALTPAVTVLSLVMIAVGLWLALRASPVFLRVAAVAIVLLVVGVSVAVAAVTVDRSGDGNQYHKLAVGALRAGWNPVWASVTTWADASPSQFDELLALQPDPYQGTWIDAYPKATWIFGASTAQLTGSIESGKAYTLYAAAALFLLVAGYLASRMPLWQAVVVGAVAALNPIAVTQVFTYYNDGLMGTVVLIGIVLLTTLVDPGWSPPPWWRFAFPAGLVSVIVVLVNIKFTGLVYVGILGLGYLAWLCVHWRRNRRAVGHLVGAGLSGTAIALAVVGASSYIRNLMTRGNPLYPLIGPGAVDILTPYAPESFAGRDPLSKFAISSLSTSSNDIPPRADLKIPGTFTADELRRFEDVDVRIAGWGVLFGALLIVSIVLAVYLLARFGRSRSRYLPAFVLPVGVTAVGIVLVDGSWWARYTPHFVVVPLVVLVALFATRARVLGVLLSAMLLANSLLIGLQQVNEQRAQRQQGPLALMLTEVAQREGCIAVTAGGYSLIGDSPIPGDVMYAGMVLNALDAVPGSRVMTREELLASDHDRLGVYYSRYFVVVAAPEPCG